MMNAKPIAEYAMAARGCTAAGAIVLCELPDNEATPFVVWFRNDPDSERAGRPAYYYGDYCSGREQAESAYKAKCERHDPDGTRHIERRRAAIN